MWLLLLFFFFVLSFSCLQIHVRLFFYLSFDKAHPAHSTLVEFFSHIIKNRNVWVFFPTFSKTENCVLGHFRWPNFRCIPSIRFTHFFTSHFQINPLDMTCMMDRTSPKSTPCWTLQTSSKIRALQGLDLAKTHGDAQQIHFCNRKFGC